MPSTSAYAQVLSSGRTSGEAVIECDRGTTCITVCVRDDSELYGLLDRIQDVALHLISLNELGDDND
jgi:hypothetical protein